MEEGLYYDFDKQPLIPPMEFWRPVTDKSVPGVRPYYWISDLGRMFNTNINRFMPQFDDGRRGYLLVTLATDRGNITKSVHRIMMIEHVGFDPDPNKNEVDHISGVKYNNSIYNTRWVSGSENIIAAYDNGLMPSGEDSPSSVLSNDDVRYVCQMMQDGIDRHKIYDFLASRGIAYPNTLFHSIYTRRSWKRISKDYAFQDYRERDSVFTTDEIHIVCQCLEKNMNHRDIIAALGMNPDLMTQDQRNNLYTAISHIKKGLHFTEISSQYSIDSDSTKNVYSDDEVHHICRRLQEGASTRQILQELGHDVTISTNRLDYYKYTNPIYKIKQRKMFTHISSNYNF